MRTEWQGSYLDGKTASRQRAVIHLMQSGLQVTTENGKTVWWPYAEIRQTQGFYSEEQVRLERGGENPEAVVIPDAGFLADLHQLAPGTTARFHNPSHRRFRVQLTIFAALTVISVSGALYFWGIPAMAAFVAPLVPVSWEERFGQAVVEDFAPPEKRCTAASQTRAIDDIMKTLTAPLTKSPYRFHVIVVDGPLVNAFAVPGGYIVVFRGLLEQTKTPEELAGVLAHEIQHIVKRHTTRAMLQRASAGLLIAALTGDAGGAMTYGLKSAHTLGLLRYSRENEEEADRDGMKLLLEAGINPEGMIDFFETLKQKGVKVPAFLKYLSTHPATEDRIQKLKSLAEQSPHQSVKLLPNYDWKDIGKICEAAKP
jgi:predicted Zn-dependent protease